jgi:hypothetical protein
MPVPAEIAIGDIYLPPMLVAALLGMIAVAITARVLDRYGWSRNFFYPPIVLIALTVVYTLLIGTILIGV